MQQRICFVAAALLVFVPATGVAQQVEPENKKHGAAKNEADNKKDRPRGYEQAAAAGELAPSPEADAANVVEANNKKEDDKVDVLADEVDPNVINLENQFLSRFRPLLKAELSFVKRVCRPDRQQRNAITRASERCLRVAVRKYAMGQNQLRHGRRAVQHILLDPNRLIQKELSTLMREKLDGHQVKRYEQELAKRVASQKRAAVLGLVAKLDEVLVLSVEQRQDMIESLSENWQDQWDQWRQIIIRNSEHMPEVSDKDVVPLLNKTQRDVWHGTQKLNRVHWGWFWGFLGDGMVVDDFDVDVALVDEQAAAAEDRADENTDPAGD